MEFLIIRHADAETEAGAKASAELVHAMTDFHVRGTEAGIVKGGAGLSPSRRGARVEFEAGKPKVIDGPFAESKELIAGYTIIDVPTLADAIEWVKGWPVEDAHGYARIQIRPFITADELVDDPALKAEIEAAAPVGR